MALLMRVWNPRWSRPPSRAARSCSASLPPTVARVEFAPWDWRFYAEQRAAASAMRSTAAR